MNPEELIELKKLIIVVADYYERPLKPSVVSMMASDLMDLPLDEIKAAFDKYRRTSKAHRFPMPSEIREMICPQVSDKNAAEALCSMIIRLIKKKDYCWPMEYWQNPSQFTHVLKAEVGNAGYRVIQRRGGWERLCREYWDSDATAFRAQFRDELEAAIKHTPEVVELAALDKSPVKSLISGANDLNKLIARKEKA